MERNNPENILSKYSVLSIFIFAILIILPINIFFDRFVMDYHEDGHYVACERTNISCSRIHINLLDPEMLGLDLRGVFTKFSSDAVVEVRPDLEAWCELSESQKQVIKLGGIVNDFKVIFVLVIMEFITLLILLAIYLTSLSKRYLFAARLSLVLILIAITLSFMLIKQMIHFNQHLISEVSDLFYFVCS